MIINDGYAYTFDKPSKRQEGLSFWRCVRKQECRGRVSVLHGAVDSVKCEHSHDPSPSAIDGTLFANCVKRKASETQESPSVIVNSSLKDTPSGSLQALPNVLD